MDYDLSTIIWVDLILYLQFQLSYHMAVQSKWTISHFDGLNAKLSAYSMPFIHFRNSGQTNADPAYAASTWSHISSSLPIKGGTNYF